MGTQDKPAVRIVVTGRGVVSAIGSTVEGFEASLAQGAGGIRRHDDLLPGQVVHVGLVEGFEPPAGLAALGVADCDRTARLAASAALQAVQEAGLWDGTRLAMPPGDVALMLGTSHGGRSQIDRYVSGGADPEDAAAALGVMHIGTHHQQTSVVAALLGIEGPTGTCSTACSSSGTAIAHALDLLQHGHVRAVVAGGADAFSKLTLAGFQALGAVADGPCGPFGERLGISLGEGAAFVVLERLEDAQARGATVLAEVYGCATTWDAHHLTAPEPSGDGMRRAIEASLGQAGLRPGDIHYVNAHGTGTRANDIAETLAIKRVFERAAAMPPVSASKSFTGHMLGASSAAGLLAGIAGHRGGHLPPTLNLDRPRPGCDLDYVPAQSRAAQVDRYLALSAAFGGCNCAISAGAPGLAQPAAAAIDDIVITGQGVISTLGCSADDAWQALFDAAAALPPAATLARVRGFDPKRHLPRGRSARMSTINQFAVAATEQALLDAGWAPTARRPGELGLMVGLSRGAACSFESCIDSVRGAAWQKASPTAFPNLVMSSVGGQVSVAVGLKGAASTMVGEAEVGVALLGHAAAWLARQPALDAMVLLAADELSPLFLRLQRSAGVHGVLPVAEGAVALVLERRSSALARGARVLAHVAGWAQGFDGSLGRPGVDAEGQVLERTLRAAITRAGAVPADVACMLTTARGEPEHDRRAAAAVRRLFGAEVPPMGAIAGNAGWAEGHGGLLSVAMAVMALHDGRVPAPASTLAVLLGAPWLADTRSGDFGRALVAASSRQGGHAAVLLQRPGIAAA